jgi:hypothetical protein
MNEKLSENEIRAALELRMNRYDVYFKPSLVTPAVKTNE